MEERKENSETVDHNSRERTSSARICFATTDLVADNILKLW